MPTGLDWEMSKDTRDTAFLVLRELCTASLIELNVFKGCQLCIVVISLLNLGIKTQCKSS